jgi:hypothetical protein
MWITSVEGILICRGIVVYRNVDVFAEVREMLVGEGHGVKAVELGCNAHEWFCNELLEYCSRKWHRGIAAALDNVSKWHMKSRSLTRCY